MLKEAFKFGKVLLQFVGRAERVHDFDEAGEYKQCACKILQKAEARVLHPFEAKVKEGRQQGCDDGDVKKYGH